MAPRLEIPKAVKLVVFRRAGGPEEVCCEGCGLPLRGKPFEYDHTVPEWMQVLPPKERTILATDVKLLGRCCHAPKTKREAGQRAHGKRIVEKSARAKVKAPWPCGRGTGWKKPVGSWNAVPR